MQPFRSVAFSDFRQPLPETVISSRTRKKRLPQSAKIEAGSADKYRDATTRFNLFDRSYCRARPVGRSERHGGRNKIDQMVRNSATLLNGNLGGSNFDLLIDLDGIAVDDFSAQPQRDLDPQRAFSRGGRTDNGNDV